MLGMVTTEAFVLETYLAAYAPKSLTASAWLNTRGEGGLSRFRPRITAVTSLSG